MAGARSWLCCKLVGKKLVIFARKFEIENGVGERLSARMQVAERRDIKEQAYGDAYVLV